MEKKRRWLNGEIDRVCLYYIIAGVNPPLGTRGKRGGEEKGKTRDHRCVQECRKKEFFILRIRGRE